MQAFQDQVYPLVPGGGADAVGARGDVILLTGSVGLADSWSSGLPRSLLPLPGGTLIGDLIGKLRSRFGGSLSVCVNGSADTYRPYLGGGNGSSSPVLFVEDKLPRGTAGCIKSCEKQLTGGEIFVLGGSVWLEDDLDWMLEEHRRQGNALTIYCIPHQVLAGGEAETRLRPAGIFCCDPVVLKYISPVGYQDVKEQLVPALQRHGLRVGAVPLRRQTHQVTDWATYLHALTRSLSGECFHTAGYQQLAPAVWCGQEVRIAEDARIVGPVLLGNRCRIGPQAVVIGPTILGDQCTVGAGAWAVRCVAAPGTVIADQACASDYFGPVPTVVQDEDYFVGGQGSTVANLVSTTGERGEYGPPASIQVKPSASTVISCVALLTAFAWAFWPNLRQLWEVWQTNADYSAGQLVPLAALYMIGTRLRDLQGLKIGLSGWGLGLLAVGLGMDTAGVYLLFASASNFGMVTAFIGLVITLIGLEGFKRIWYPVLFLYLMLPLPGRMHDAIMLPLQGASAALSGSFLEVIGVPVERFGNVLEVGGQRVAVAEACNGLRMAMAFLIVTGLVAYVIRRPAWQRVVVLFSSVPIALGCNIIRIVATALLYYAGHEWLAQGIFHDGAGLLMMPLALSMIVLELWFLSTLYAPTLSRAAYAGGLGRRSPVSAR